MKMSVVMCVWAAAWGLAACEGSDLHRPLSRDVLPDDGDVTDPDVTQVHPTLAWWFAGASGAIGRDQSLVVLAAADEPVPYQGAPGFQIDLAAMTERVPEGTSLKLLLADAEIATALVGADGTASFVGVELPADGAGARLRVEGAVGAETFSVEKVARLDLGPCALSIQLPFDSDGCSVGSAELAGQVGFTLTAGACATVEAVVRAGGVEYALTSAAFDEDGVAKLPLPGAVVLEDFDGELQVEAWARHGEDAARDGHAEAQSPVDAAGPAVTWVQPPEGSNLLWAEWDADQDLTNGYQLLVSVRVDEAGEVVLYRDGVEVGRDDAVAGADVVFGALELLDLGALGRIELSVEATDGCGNARRATRELVRAEGGMIAITHPQDDAVLLAAADGDPVTVTVYDTSFAIQTEGIAAGTPLEVRCQAQDGGTWTLVGQATAGSAPTLTIPVHIPVETLGTLVRCEAWAETDAGTITSPAVGLLLAIPAPTLEVTTPPEGACVASGTIGLEGRGSGLDGRALALVGQGPTGPFSVEDFATVQAGDWSGTWAGVDVDGDYQFLLQGTDAAGNPVEASRVVKVDRVAPVVAFQNVPPLIEGWVTEDEDPNEVGFQTTIAASVVDAGGDVRVCLTVQGQERCLDPGVPLVWSGVTLLTGDNTLALSAEDACGNRAARVVATVVLDDSSPVSIVIPADHAILLARNDQNLTTSQIYETNFTVSASEAGTGARLEVHCGSTEQATAVVGALTITTVAADGRYALPVALPEGGAARVCRARVVVDGRTTDSAFIHITVALPLPTLTISVPAADACVNGPFEVSGASTGLDGESVAIRMVTSGGAVVAGATGVSTADTWTAMFVPDADVPDGDYRLHVDAIDGFGNHVSDGQAPSVSIALDRTAPTLTWVGPEADLSAVDDVDPLRPGVQVDVVVQLADTRAAQGQVCLAVGNGRANCIPVTDVTGRAQFPAVTLASGDNTLNVSATDACGNASNPLSQIVTVHEEAPRVTIVTPAGDETTLATKRTLVVEVVDRDGVPVLGAEVHLFAGGTDTLLGAVESVDGTYTFADVSLALGQVTEFFAEASISGGAEGRSESRFITQKNVQPTIALTQPVEGEILNLSSLACAGATPACVLAAVVTTTGAEDGSVVAVEATCGGQPLVASGTVVGGTATLSAISLPHGTTCTLTPGVTDALGQTAAGVAVTVQVDRVAPTVAVTAPDVLLSTGDDRDPQVPGIQAALTASLGGVEAGVVATATLTWLEGGQPQNAVFTHEVQVGVIDGDSYVATFTPAGESWVTWPEALVTVSIEVTDRAGNAGTGVRSVAVNSAAGVRITAPIAPADSCDSGCAAGGTCYQGACWTVWGLANSRQLIAVLSGVQTTTDNVRVCSDALVLAGSGAAACASEAGSGGAFYEVARWGLSNGSRALDLGALLPDGFQRLVVEVQPVAGGPWLSSQGALVATERERRVLVDVTPPVVSDLGSPSDTLPPVGTLNALEQLAEPRVFQLSFVASEPGTAQVYINGVAGSPSTVVAGSNRVSATLPEGAPEVWVVLTDGVGNRSALSPSVGALRYVPTVDVTPPTLVFVRPNVSPLIIGSNRDIVLTSNAEGATVTLSDSGSVVATGTVSGGSVTFAHAALGILSDGTHRLTATVADAALNSQSAATTPAAIVVDTTPPSGVILAPADTSQLTASDDASSAPGFQAGVRFGTGAGAVSWRLLVSSECGGDFSGCAAPLLAESGSVSAPDGEEPMVPVTLLISSQVSYHILTLEVRDAVGNVATVQTRVGVQVDTCAVSLTNLPASGWFNTGSCATPGNCAAADVSVTATLVGLCDVDRLVLYDGSSVVATITSPASSESFTLHIVDGTPVTLAAVAYKASDEVAASPSTVLGVDLTAPQVAFVAQTVGGFATAASGSSVTWAVAQDTNPNLGGLQFHSAVTVQDANLVGGQLEGYSASRGGTTSPLLPSNVALPLVLSAGSPQTHQLLAATLSDGAAQTIEISAVDAAGNRAKTSFRATVDVTAPAAVAMVVTNVQKRRPRLFPMQWTAVADNGTMEGGPVARYEIRYSTAPITEANWSAACAASQLAGSGVIPAPTAPGTPMSYLVGGFDTRPMTDPCKLEVQVSDGSPASEVVQYWGIRAQDQAGNWSPLGPTSVRAITRGEIALDLARVRFDNTSGAFGVEPGGAPINLDYLTYNGAIIGDINGDGYQDWAVGSFLMSGFCVVLGEAGGPVDRTLTAPQSARHTCLMSAGVGAVLAGVSQVGHQLEPLGDVNGDGLADFAVTGRTADSQGEGFIFVYLGRQNQLPDLTAPNLIIRGMQITVGAYLGVCAAGDFDGAPRGGALAGDIAVGEARANRVHIIPGDAGWNANTHATLDIRTAGALTSWGALSITATGAAVAGLGYHCAPAGDVLPTPVGVGTGSKSDLLVHQLSGGASGASRVFVFAGREFVGGQTETVTDLAGTLTAEDQRSLRLVEESGQRRLTTQLNFQGDIDFTGDGVSDILVSNGQRSPEVNLSGTPGDGKTIAIYDGSKLPSKLGTEVRVQVSGAPSGLSWVGVNGWVLYGSAAPTIRGVRAIGDFNSWGYGNPTRPTIDLAIGVNNAAGRPDAIELRMNHRSSTIPFGSFPVVDSEFFNWYHDEQHGIGVWIDGGVDLTGDGNLDIISGSARGEVLIVR